MRHLLHDLRFGYRALLMRPGLWAILYLLTASFLLFVVLR